MFLIDLHGFTRTQKLQFDYPLSTILDRGPGRVCGFSYARGLCCMCSHFGEADHAVPHMRTHAIQSQLATFAMAAGNSGDR